MLDQVSTDEHLTVGEKEKRNQDKRRLANIACLLPNDLVSAKTCDTGDFVNSNDEMDLESVIEDRDRYKTTD
jgi:hypothetical protein